jgi:hypothetical protein
MWKCGSVGGTSWTDDQPGRKAATYTGQHKQKKRTHTSISRVGFERMTPVFERTKTFHAVDRAATVIGVLCFRGN